MIRRVSVMSVVAGAMLAGCGGGDAGPTAPSPTPTPTPTVQTITVTPNSASLKPGDTLRLTAVPRDASGNALSGAAINWSSNPQNVATVSSSGLITAIAVGTATVTAGVGGVSGTASIIIQQPPSPGTARVIELNYPAALLARGQPLQLAAALRDSVGNVLTGRVLAWTSANPAIVRVDASGAAGNLTAVSTGTTTVTGTVDGVSATSTVTVIAFASISAGPMVSCAITTDGRLYCAGGIYGSAAQPVARSLRFSAISSNGQGPGGAAETCGLVTDGSAYCWGDNPSGQLGVGDLDSRSEPTRVTGDLRFASISVGRDYACGLTSDGDAFCWGAGSTGQLGTGNTFLRTIPVAVQTGLKFTQLEAGSGTTCGLSGSGKAYCWGRNDLGQLGTGLGTGGQIGDQNLAPTSVGEPLATSVLKQIVTRGPKTCALTSEGKAFCWGNNTVFELGAPTAFRCYGGKPCSLSPIAVSSSATFTSLTASQYATCGITSSTETLCWGMDYENLFGAAAVVPRCPVSGALYGCTATPVRGPSGFLTLSGSISNHCGMKSDGIAYCWGGNAFGQRGWGGSEPDPTPRPFSIAPGAAP